MSIVFRQLFDSDTCTLSYLLADPLSGDALIIDPVRERVGACVSLLQELDLKLVWILQTHVHGDALSEVAGLREITGADTACSADAGVAEVDRCLGDGDTVVFGGELLRVLATPGHTPGCVTYQWRDRLFTGDCLTLGGCGRSDFPGGDPARLYDSVERLFALPDETLVYPGHDYAGRRVGCVGEERATNPRLAGRSKEDFVALMSALQLPPPAGPDANPPDDSHHERPQPSPIIDVHTV